MGERATIESVHGKPLVEFDGWRLKVTSYTGKTPRSVAVAVTLSDLKSMIEEWERVGGGEQGPT